MVILKKIDSLASRLVYLSYSGYKYASLLRACPLGQPIKINNIEGIQIRFSDKLPSERADTCGIDHLSAMSEARTFLLGEIK